MTKILPFLNDPGITRQWIDHEDGNITVTETEDATALVEANKRIQNSHDGFTQSRDMQFVARIPRTVIEQYAKRGINLYHQAYEAELHRLLNDSDYRGFRTGLGHIGPKHKHV